MHTVNEFFYIHMMYVCSSSHNYVCLTIMKMGLMFQWFINSIYRKCN